MHETISLPAECFSNETHRSVCFSLVVSIFERAAASLRTAARVTGIVVIHISTSGAVELLPLLEFRKKEWKTRSFSCRPLAKPSLAEAAQVVGDPPK
jgi:hypothetical protein